MRHPPLAPDWIDRPHLRIDLGDQLLESGTVLSDAFVTAVAAWRRGPARHGEVILALTAIGSTHHRLDFLIGPGAPLDSDRFCIVVIDALGNGLSTSPSNSIRQPDASFPAITIRDMVESQRRALDWLGVDRLAAVVGASMGGMQALQWAVSHPARMDRVIAMTPMARTSRWSQLVNEMSRRALFADVACQLPRPRSEAMRLWVPLTQMVMARSPEAAQELPSQVALFEWLAAAEAELAEHGPDPYDWACQSRAYDGHDIGATSGFEGDTSRALASIVAEVLIAAPARDLYNPSFAAHDAATGIRRVRRLVLPGDDGHRSASGVAPVSTAALRSAITDFLR